MTSKYPVISNLAVYGSGHALVDATCAAVVFSSLKIQMTGVGELINLVVLYNVLAFGLQALLGLAVDQWHAPRFSAALGCILTASSAILLWGSPLLAVLLAGIGNALFHVGGGSISLNLTPKRATAPGIFVAPGALGLLIGTWVGTGGYFIGWPFVSLLSVTCVAIFATREPKIDYRKGKAGSQPGFFEVILLLLLLTIAVRSLVGLAVVLPWKSDKVLLLILTVAVLLGKALGGVLADGFGWMRVAVGSLIISAPLAAFGARIPSVAILGMFLFNIAMPVTLVGVSNSLPGRPAFSFGLTCLALILGAFPTFTELKPLFGVTWIVFPVILASAAILFGGLWLHNKETYSALRKAECPGLPSTQPSRAVRPTP